MIIGISGGEAAEPKPVFELRFEKPPAPPTQLHGSAARVEDPERKGHVLHLTKPVDWVALLDVGTNSPLDFGLGDSITLEAWVKPDGVDRDHQYIISKGRNRSGSDQQNYALRLSNGAPNFLFRSVSDQWHRWTALETAVPNRWYHLAIVYTFGKADSLEGWLNGHRVKGTWDMGGATDAAPVQDDDDLWVGAAQGGKANVFTGFLDDLVIHRTRLDAKILASGKPTFPPATSEWPDDLPMDVVRVTVAERASFKQFPRHARVFYRCFPGGDRHRALSSDQRSRSKPWQQRWQHPASYRRLHVPRRHRRTPH